MAGLTGRVLYAGDPGWEDARMNYNSRFDLQPRAVVYCQSKEDVANAIRWVRANQVPFRARSGRHNYAGYSLVAGGLIIDVGDMESVSVDREAGTATIGAGIYMLECSEALGEVGVTIPLATGITVGLAGLTLGGGFGITSRKFGLTCDSLLEVELVNANGEIMTANAVDNPDLFWACKGGGGGNFGIVTSFTFRTHPVNNVAMLMVQWPWTQFDQVVAAWQTWAHDVDPGISAVLQLRSDQTIKLYGQYTAADGELPNLTELLAPLLAAAPPPSPPVTQVVPFVMAARLFLAEGTETVDPANPVWAVHVHSDHQLFKSTSAVAMTPFDEAAIATLRRFLEAVPPLSAPPSQPSMVQLLPGGGAIGEVAPDETAIPYRKAQFIVQYDSFWTAPQDADKTIAWVESFRTTMLPYAQGAYVNYVDDLLPDYLSQYYGANLNRLVQVKGQVDPENLFNFPQSIPTKL
jgi:FAD/FMN-containing dehydrogenase